MEAQAINGKYDLFETVQESLRLADRVFERGFLMGREVEALQLEGVRFAHFHSLDVRYGNLRAVRTTFDRCDFSCTTFAGGYFRDVDFTGCSFRGVRFTDCVFDRCRLPKDAEVAMERCLFFEAEAPKVVPVAAPVEAKKPTAAAPEAVMAGRFSSIER